MKCLQLELLSQSIPHSEKDKLASITYNYDTCLISYEAYLLVKTIMVKNTMPNASNFEPACNSNVGQKMVLPISHHVLNQRSETLNGPTPLPLLRKPDALMQCSASISEISSRTMDDLAKAYFDSVQKNAGRK